MRITHFVQLGFAIVDENYGKTPPAEKDVFWNGAVLPMYSEAAVKNPIHALVGSASSVLYGLKMAIVLGLFRLILMTDDIVHIGSLVTS